jgi:UDP-N-acetylmuramyl pentapeptide synthase
MDLLPHEKMFWPSLSVHDSELSLKGSQSTLEIDDQDYRLDLQMLGRHQIENARLALAAGIMINELELTPLPHHLDRPRSIDPSLIEQLLRGLSAQAPASMRGELYAYHRPIQLSDKRQVSREASQSQSEESRGTLWVDCYNANPQSMLASVKTFFESGEEGALILGSIGELGDSSSQLHRELGQSISTFIGEKTTLFTVGDQAHFMYLGLQEAGIDPCRLYHYSQGELENLLIEVASLNPPSILIKGSRSVQLERLLDPLGSIPLSSLSHPKE